MTRESLPADATPTSNALVEAAAELRDAVGELKFAPPVACVYNPLDYAWEAHQTYLQRYGDSPKNIVFLGMNPGPFGMVQTGIPFGEIPAVRDWLKIEAPIRKPPCEHPKRPVLGFPCRKSEVSGRRLWGLFAQRYADARLFFQHHFVINYCPLAFVEESGRNRTPDKLPASESAPLEEICARHLRKVLHILQPEWLVGVGQFAAERARAINDLPELKIVCITHPSPANPAANRDWAGTVTVQLQKAGIWQKYVDMSSS